MANLIIRPATGAGNKVVVQDQAGAAVLTTADSGATIANATLATPVLTGATGSLTAPTIANMANCTFPAGHPVQVVHKLVNTGSFSTTSSSFVAYSGLDTSITLKSTNPIIIYTLNASMTNFAAGTENYFRLTNFINTGSGEGSENVLTDGYDFLHDRIGGLWSGVYGSFSWNLTASIGHIYRYRIQANTTSGTAWLKYSDGSVLVTITEIQT